MVILPPPACIYIYTRVYSYIYFLCVVNPGRMATLIVVMLYARGGVLNGIRGRETHTCVHVKFLSVCGDGRASYETRRGNGAKQWEYVARHDGTRTKHGNPRVVAAVSANRHFVRGELEEAVAPRVQQSSRSF